MLRGIAFLCIAAVACVVALAASQATAGRDLGEQIGKTTSHGSEALISVSGEVRHPKTIAMRIRVRPAQSVRGTYTIWCLHGNKEDERQGHFSGRAPVIEQIQLTLEEPNYCSIAATASIEGHGKIKAALFAKQR